MKIYIPTSDSSMHIIPVFSYFIKKYWENHPQVVFLGFSEPNFPLEEGMSFHSMSDEQEGGVANWSTYILDFFNSIDDKFFMFACDDHFIVRPVDEDVVKASESLIGIDESIGRLDLTPSIQMADNRKNSVNYYRLHKGVEFLNLDQHSPPGNFIYKITGAWSIWRREYFLRNIKRGITPQQWELQCGRRAEGDGFEILGAKDRWAVRKIEGLSGSQFPGKVNLFYVRHEDVDNILSRKLIREGLLPRYVRREYGKDKDNIVFEKFKRYNLKSIN